MDSPKVLFICKKRSNNIKGYGFGLGNSASFVSRMLQDNKIKSDVALALDANYIDRIVTEYDPNIVILEAIWVTPAKMAELFSIKRHRERKWIVRVHSRISFLSYEGVAFPWLKGYKAVMQQFPQIEFLIAPNTKETTYIFQSCFDLPSVYLPNIYTANYNLEPKSRQDGIVKIGCFGAIRPFKNHLTQGLSAIEFANLNKLKLEFHINSDRCEQRGECVLKNLISAFEMQKNHKLIEHGWMEHETFVKLVNQMDLGMQVSFSETFNLVAADFVMCNVPIVTSSQIKWIPKKFHADCNSTRNIVEVLNYAWKGAYSSDEAKNCLLESNQIAEGIWMKYITGAS